MAFPVPRNLKSAFPNQPGDLGSTVGRAGSVAFAVEIEGLYAALRKYSQASPAFNEMIRKKSTELATELLEAQRVEAGTVSRSRQALAVMSGMKVKKDRIPSIRLQHNRLFPSKSRSNRKRGLVQGPGLTRKVTMGDVFFGAEFGGGAKPSTRQFLRHRGQSGYFFWPTVRKRKNEIAKKYLEGIDEVVKELNIG